jgi:hypothetical protein
LVDAVQPASAAGQVVLVPNSHAIIGRAGGVGTTLRETGRQRVTLEISVWAPSETLRNEVASIVEPSLRDIRRLTLADQSIAVVWFGQVADTDELAKSNLYRRTFWLDAEYASTVTSTAAQIVSFIETVTQAADLTGAQVTPVISIVS